MIDGGQTMKKRICFAAAVVLVWAGMLPGADSPTGYEIASKVKSANEAISSQVTAQLKLFSSASASVPNETRSVAMRSKKIGNGLKKHVFRFTDSRYRGTTFLSIDNAGSDTTYYLYLNTVGRPRRLSSGEKQNQFIDTDFTNEELGGFDLDDYTYTRIGDIQYNGKTHYRVWCHKKDTSAKYPKFLAIVDPAKWVIVKISVYNKANRIEKVGVFSDVRLVAGKYHVPHRMRVEDQIKNHATEISISSIVVDRPVSDSYFLPQSMNNPW